MADDPVPPRTDLVLHARRDVARAVLMAQQVAQAHGLDKKERHRLATAVSELATNIVRYAGGGVLSLRLVTQRGQRGLRVTASDDGPGIEDIDAALRDHHSSGGSLGLGLPGVRRMMSDFEIDSRPGHGTRVTATLWLGWAMQIEHAARIRPAAGQLRSGDAVVINKTPHGIIATVIDVQGHGDRAADAADHVVSALHGDCPDQPINLLKWLAERFVGERAFAAATLSIDSRTSTLCFAGIGNVMGRVANTMNAHLVPQSGSIGASVGGFPHRLREQRHVLLPPAIVLVHTDGVGHGFTQHGYPTMGFHSAAEIASTMVERFGKPHDDATCLAIRCHEDTA